ncbi:class I SAM-dependent methyltransferase [Roseococcus sp.]|uniref:class I SAM-dependent methyltransferase n=1 Tax=Roseococcus sp. TaxID=2109646 RepID=UPI003BADA592
MVSDDENLPIEPAVARVLFEELAGREATEDELDRLPALRETVRQLTNDPLHFRQLYASIGHMFFYGNLSSRIDVDICPEQHQQLLSRIRASWSALGTATPHWSVMANPRYLPKELTAELEEEFYSTGRLDVDAVKARLGRLGVALSSGCRVLDFGCGLGRLGQHLSADFQSYCGVDVSSPHLDYARGRLTGLGRGNFRLVPIEDFLAWPPSHERFDLVISLLTLQHNPPPLISTLFRRLIASIAPGGAAYVQLPTFLHDYTFDAANYIAHPRPVGEMEMHAFPMHLALATIREEGCEILEVVTDGRVGSMGISSGFVVRRPRVAPPHRLGLASRLRRLLGRSSSSGASDKSAGATRTSEANN